MKVWHVARVYQRSGYFNGKGSMRKGEIMKRFKRNTLVLALALSVCGTNSFGVKASSVSDLRQEKEDTEQKKEEAQGFVDRLKEEQLSIMDAIKALDDEVDKYNKQIIELQEKKQGLDIDIKKTKKKLAKAKEDEKDQYESMKKRIQYSYENGNVEYADTLFSSSEMSDMVNKSEYVEQIYSYDSNMLETLVKARRLVSDTEAELEAELDSVKKLEADLASSKEALEVVISGKETQVANYEASIDEYEAIVAEYQAAEDELDKAIEEAERKQREEEGNYPPYTGGKLGWPVPAKYTYISSYYGPRDLLGMSFHHGIDIPCPFGTSIFASESGTVIFAGWNYSLGNYVCIDHGGGLSTVYGHNSSLAVSAGQKVSKGEVIAYAGSTGLSTDNHCHIAVRVNGSYVDPLPYLQ